MTNPERFKEALDDAEHMHDDGPGSMLESHWYEKHKAAITEALSLAQSGYVLPVLPDGWYYWGNFREDGPYEDGHKFYRVGIGKGSIFEFGPDEYRDGTGPTPYEAAQQAIERITEKKL